MNIFFILLIILFNATENQQVIQVDLKKIASKNPETCEFKTSKDYDKDVLFFKAKEGNDFLQIFNEDDKVGWSKMNYLVLDVIQNADYSGIIYIDFYKKGEVKAETTIVQQGGEANKARITPKIGIMPHLRTQVILPLHYLDGQEIFMARHPRQLKGTVLGRRLDMSDIGKVRVRIEPFMLPEYNPQIQIGAIYLSQNLPDPLPTQQPVVDELGQWNVKDWKGKVKSEEDLKSKMASLESSTKSSSFPNDWSKYGGWKKKEFKPSGFFRTHHDGTRWWLVDPDGYGFLSAGIDCIDNNASGSVSGNEDLFKWLPDTVDLQYKAAVTERKGNKMVDFLKTNLIRTYGENWNTKWQEITAAQMKKYRINTVANWSDIDFAQKAKIPYVIPMKDFPSTEIKLFRDFPDVYDPYYKKAAINFARQLETFKDDPYLIGYFLSNEPHWAFGEHWIAFEMFGTDQKSHTKTEFISWLKKKYRKVDSFNAAWNLKLNKLEDLEREIFKETSDVSAKGFNDMKEFSGIMVDEYVKTVCDEVKKVDPNHLNLGLRYAWISSELCYRAGAYFDVFSINGYSFPGPPPTAEVAKRSGKPIMIGEFHFGSTDRGLPANGIQGAKDQNARGEAYRYYFEQGFARPEIIGLHYFQWNDQPILGRFDGENYNIGLFDICNQPHEELLEHLKISHEKVYQVASGEEKPYDKVIEKVPQIFY